MAEIVKLSQSSELEETIARNRHRLRGARSKATLRSYATGWRIFEKWCAESGLSALPADQDTVAEFIRELDTSFATCKSRVAAINHTHKLAELPLPGNSLAVEGALEAVARSKGVAQKQAKPMNAGDLAKVLDKLDVEAAYLLREDRESQYRDAALIALAYDTACRRSEIAGFRVCDVSTASDGSGLVWLAKSKTDQQGEGQHKWLSPDTMRRIGLYLSLTLRRGEEPLFGAISRADEFAGLTGQGIARIIARRGEQFGIEGLTGHSTRVGHIQDASAANLEPGAIMLTTGHKSPRMISRYNAKANVRKSSAAMLAKAQGR